MQCNRMNTMTLIALSGLIFWPVVHSMPSFASEETLGSTTTSKVTSLEKMNTDSTSSEPEQSEVIKSDSDVLVLTYPDFGPLNTLPEDKKPIVEQPSVQKQESVEPALLAIHSSSDNNRQSQSQSQSQSPAERNVSDEPFTLESLDLSGLDPEIARKVASAMSQIDTPNPVPTNRISLEGNESKYQGRLPAMNLQTHMYSSDSHRRWIKINGQELREGDRLNNVQIVEISPQSVTIRFDNELIEVPALYEWAG
ncbi:hypothetical protein BCU70_08805 [Vibrio sp. 10N.286.49.C2]|uniref:general secretion pathway protein GspB n=1 Tax=unclassified Vibrio TaxID=2614977 RepID=UPI000C8355CD|nr:MULTISPECIES: general secretion pathway protein GspB [unclassified Vibrio]PMH27542.1 hypothetical protein BCU70_08805 [Vibrio sp. 10N.286.49.C2]PMH52967.1 hypothetical protein BCU66_14930 [Vibrio sp. 10N.286.49.B1]PMH83398.1 hypothetical protein BCU58_14925 [Vibrio sp. 10N.286.48.B7]